MVALIDGGDDLKDLISIFLEHRREVARRTVYALRKARESAPTCSKA